MVRSQYNVVGVFFGWLLLGGCAEESSGREIELDEGRAYVTNTWPKGQAIPVCFEELVAEDQRERELIRRAVVGSWGTVAAIEFTGFERCKDDDRGLRVVFADEGPHTEGLGVQLDGVKNGVVLNLSFKNWSVLCQDQRDYCIEAIAVHEFGHAIGFAHEQNRPDAPAWCQKEQGADGDLVIGEFDLASIMNYCNPEWNGGGLLSAGDIQAAQTIYGSNGSFKAPDITRSLGRSVAGAQWFTGDLNGDNLTDLIQIAGDGGGLRAYRSEGGLFTASTDEVAMPAGSIARLVVDLDGDRSAEFVQLSEDAGQLAATVVAAASGEPRILLDDLVGPIAPTLAHMVGDVDGDGTGEVVQVLARDQHVVLTTLALRHGEIVTLWENDGEPLDSGQSSTWHAGDVDADGLLDVIQAWSFAATQGFTVYRSTGHGFTTHWPSTGTGPLLHGLATRVGDVNGDGRTDLLEVFVDGEDLGVGLFTSSGSGYRGSVASLGPAPTAPLAWVSGDFDADGLDDLLLAHAQKDRLALSEFRSSGDRLQLGFAVDNFGVDPAAAAWLDGDVDGDGRGDLIQIHDADGQVELKVYRSDL